MTFIRPPIIAATPEPSVQDALIGGPAGVTILLFVVMTVFAFLMAILLVWVANVVMDKFFP